MMFYNTAEKSTELLVRDHLLSQLPSTDTEQHNRYNDYIYYGLDDRKIVVGFPAGNRDISLLQNVQTGSGAHPAFYSMGTTGSFARSKGAGA
jgi:hypothetical protein